ncbi:MAG: GNAT family N-acetyltransferase [Candidatus Lokiarchaeota archaeon]|nr:GNAT family N-acetyltransferase [Candidatus Lokiarchaeota archaeon]
MSDPETLASKILVRNYRKSDYEATISLMEDISETFSFYFDKEKWTESAGLRLFQPGFSRTTLVAELDGQVVGMGFIELVTNTPDGLSVGYLSNWGVKKGFRGSGVGRVLAEKAIAMLTAMNADLIRIKIAMKPDPAKTLAIVKNIGFEPSYITVEKKINPSGKKKEGQPV